MKKIPFDKNDLKDLSPEHIDKLKEEYPSGVFQLEVSGKKCWLHKPDRHILDLASNSSRKKDSKFNETILKNCWLAGDKEIVFDDEYFFGASAQLSELIQYADATLKKL